MLVWGLDRGQLQITSDGGQSPPLFPADSHPPAAHPKLPALSHPEVSRVCSEAAAGLESGCSKERFFPAAAPACLCFPPLPPAPPPAVSEELSLGDQSSLILLQLPWLSLTDPFSCRALPGARSVQQNCLPTLPGQHSSKAGSQQLSCPPCWEASLVLGTLTASPVHMGCSKGDLSWTQISPGFCPHGSCNSLLSKIEAQTLTLQRNFWQPRRKWHWKMLPVGMDTSFIQGLQIRAHPSPEGHTRTKHKSWAQPFPVEPGGCWLNKAEGFWKSLLLPLKPG